MSCALEIANELLADKVKDLEEKYKKLSSELIAEKKMTKKLTKVIQEQTTIIEEFQSGMDEGAFKMVEKLSKELGEKEDKIMEMELEHQSCEERWEKRTKDARRAYEISEIFCQATTSYEPPAHEILEAIDEWSTDLEMTIECLNRFLDIPRGNVYTKEQIKKLWFSARESGYFKDVDDLYDENEGDATTEEDIIDLMIMNLNDVKDYQGNNIYRFHNPRFEETNEVPEHDDIILNLNVQEFNDLQRNGR